MGATLTTTKLASGLTEHAIALHQDLVVYQKAFEAAMTIFELSKTFPRAEIFSLTDQIRRSSRSVCANLAEAWRKRRYEAAFAGKLSECEAEAAETQVWIDFAETCQYLRTEPARALRDTYDEVLRMLVTMIHQSQAWIIKN